MDAWSFQTFAGLSFLTRGVLSHCWRESWTCALYCSTSYFHFHSTLLETYCPHRYDARSFKCLSLPSCIHSRVFFLLVLTSLAVSRIHRYPTFGLELALQPRVSLAGIVTMMAGILFVPVLLESDPVWLAGSPLVAAGTALTVTYLFAGRISRGRPMP